MDMFGEMKICGKINPNPTVATRFPCGGPQHSSLDITWVCEHPVWHPKRDHSHGAGTASDVLLTKQKTGPSTPSPARGKRRVSQRVYARYPPIFEIDESSLILHNSWLHTKYTLLP